MKHAVVLYPLPLGGYVHGDSAPQVWILQPPSERVMTTNKSVALPFPFSEMYTGWGTVIQLVPMWNS